MHNPLISVIIPAYNNEQTLGVALESILNQTYKNLEVIVVDDFSTDGTHAVAESYAAQDLRVRVINGDDDPNRFDAKLNRNINAGWSARNAGLAVARGEYITFQDGDDASLLNRIEAQLRLVEKYNAAHLTLNCVPFDERLVGKKLDVETFVKNEKVEVLGPAEIYHLSQKTKGIIPKLFSALNRAIPFYIKRKRIINKFFFGSLTSYPGTAGIPLFKREVKDKVRFRPLAERVWPSFMGRGADRDFNFQVAETFKNSYFVSLPLYLWRTPAQNNKPSNFSLAKYLIE